MTSGLRSFRLMWVMGSMVLGVPVSCSGGNGKSSGGDREPAPDSAPADKGYREFEPPVVTSLAGKVDLVAAELLSDGRVALAANGADFGSSGRSVQLLALLDRQGNLDTNFGDKGWLLIDKAGSRYADALIVDGSDRIVLVGHRREDKHQMTITVQRFNAKGEADLSFGSQGEVAHALPDTVHDYSESRPLFAQMSGDSILVVTEATATAWEDRYQQIYSIALNAAGGLVEGYGTSGVSHVPGRLRSGGFDRLTSMTVDRKGRLVLAVQSTIAGDNPSRLNPHFIRLTSDGAADAEFATSGYGPGVVVWTSKSQASDEHFEAPLQEQPDGNYVMAGVSSNKPTLAAMSEGGVIVASFGTQGYLPTEGTDCKIVRIDADLSSWCLGVFDYRDPKNGASVLPIWHLYRLGADGKVSAALDSTSFAKPSLLEISGDVRMLASSEAIYIVGTFSKGSKKLYVAYGPRSMLP